MNYQDDIREKIEKKNENLSTVSFDLRCGMSVRRRQEATTVYEVGYVC